MPHTLPSPSSWTFDPLAILFLLAMLGGYLVLIGPLSERYAQGPKLTLSRRICFFAGVAVLAVTIFSPLDTVGRYYLVSAHMFELLIVTTLAAPLIMLGIPEWAVWRVLPTRALRDATRGFMFGVVAVLGFNMLVLVWQVNPLFDSAQRSIQVHDLQNLCFLLAGFLTWWPLLTPLDHHKRMATASQMLYLLVESLPLDIFGVAMLFIQHVFYPIYEHAPRLLGMSPIVDQNVAGAILAAPGNIVDLALLSVIFFKWVANLEREQNARERDEAERELAELEAYTLAREAANQVNVEGAQG